MLQMVMAEIGTMREEFRQSLRELDRTMDRRPDITRDIDRELARMRRQLEKARHLIFSPQPSPADLRDGLRLCKHGMSTLRELGARFPIESTQIFRDSSDELRALTHTANELLHEETQKETEEGSAS